jgi:hypothetical protein
MEHGTTFGMHLSNLNPITKLNEDCRDDSRSDRSSLRTAVLQHTAVGESFLFPIHRVSRKTKAERLRVYPLPQCRPLERPMAKKVIGLLSKECGGTEGPAGSCTRKSHGVTPGRD